LNAHLGIGGHGSKHWVCLEVLLELFRAVDDHIQKLVNLRFVFNALSLEEEEKEDGVQEKLP